MLRFLYIEQAGLTIAPMMRLFGFFVLAKRLFHHSNRLFLRLKRNFAKEKNHIMLSTKLLELLIAISFIHLLFFLCVVEAPLLCHFQYQKDQDF